MGQSPSIPSEHYRLIFSSNSLRNNEISCDALGIHYQLSTPPDGLTSITRWDPRKESDILIAEWERKNYGKDRVRMASSQVLIPDGCESEDGLVRVEEFMQKTGGYTGAVQVDLTSSANNGKRYTWKSRDASLKLYEEGSEFPIAEYHEQFYVLNKRKTHIRLAPGCDEILDFIIVTCLITEKKRRDALGAERIGGD